MVVDRKGNIVGEGYKQIIRGTSFTQHAERVALDAARWTDSRKLSVHYAGAMPGKKSEIQIFVPVPDASSKGIKTVIVGVLDNSPSMKPGSGRAYLEVLVNIDVILYDAYKNRIKQELMPVLYEIPKSARQG